MQLLLGQMLTDESFVVSLAEYEVRPSGPGFLLGSGLAIYAFWQVSTLAGLLAGANLPHGLGLEFALPASLICLVFLLVRARDTALVALLAAMLTLALRPLVSDAWSVLAATLLAATLGVGAKTWRSRS
jgi:predicted branched-subunit amino acid permease